MIPETPVSGLFGIPWLSLASMFGGGTFGLALVALIKVWPTLNKQGIEARALRRKGDRDDLHDCHERLDKVEARLEKLVAELHAAEVAKIMMLAAYGIVDAGLERESPAAPELYQARALLRNAWPVGMAMPENIAKILRPGGEVG